MTGEQGQGRRCIGRADEPRRDVIQEGMDDAGGDDDPRNGAEGDAEIDERRADGEQDEGHVVDVETWDAPRGGPE